MEEQKLQNEIVVGMVGLGYVGLPLALNLGKTYKVYGYDISPRRIEKLSAGIDENEETLGEDLENTTVEFSNDPSILKKCNFIIVGVPTPITENKKPDLSYLESASKLVGENLTKGSIVVFESTVYPGATEEVCVPVIDKASNLQCGVDWKIGYSPERINPGDLDHTVDKITKVTAGMDEESSDTIAEVYSKVTKIHKASSIKVAEAAKVIENTQRDLNIALVNELSLIFKKLDIDTLDVLEAAGTKWNFLPFRPGLVGGHCIGVDPYYLTYKAEELGYNPQVILAGRRINDSMSHEVVKLLMHRLNEQKKPLNGSNILILGATFKENVRDSRNSKVEDVIHELKALNANVILNDPFFENEVRFDRLSHKITSLDSINSESEIDAVILAVNHKSYKELSLQKIKGWMKNPILIDIKGLYGKDKAITRL